MATSVDTQGRTAQQFCEQLDFNIDITWRGRQGVHRIDDNRRAVLTLSTRGTADHFAKLQVLVADKNDGYIASHDFVFDEHLPRDERTDNREDYPLGQNVCFEVIAYVGWKWYIAQPQSTRPLCEAIESWIDDWR